MVAPRRATGSQRTAEQSTAPTFRDLTKRIGVLVEGLKYLGETLPDGNEQRRIVAAAVDELHTGTDYLSSTGQVQLDEVPKHLENVILGLLQIEAGLRNVAETPAPDLAGVVGKIAEGLRGLPDRIADVIRYREAQIRRTFADRITRTFMGDVLPEDELSEAVADSPTPAPAAPPAAAPSARAPVAPAPAPRPAPATAETEVPAAPRGTDPYGQAPPQIPAGEGGLGPREIAVRALGADAAARRPSPPAASAALDAEAPSEAKAVIEELLRVSGVAIGPRGGADAPRTGSTLSGHVSGADAAAAPAQGRATDGRDRRMTTETGVAVDVPKEPARDGPTPEGEAAAPSSTQLIELPEE